MELELEGDDSRGQRGGGQVEGGRPLVSITLREIDCETEFPEGATPAGRAKNHDLFRSLPDSETTSASSTEFQRAVLL